MASSLGLWSYIYIGVYNIYILAYKSYIASSYVYIVVYKSYIFIVVYKFTCSRDVNTTYIGMSKRHLVTRAREHLQLNSNATKSAISQHFSSCQTCHNCNLDVSSFKVIKNCHNEYETKIQEALLIKQPTPRLNSQLYANGCSFLLNVF